MDMKPGKKVKFSFLVMFLGFFILLIIISLIGESIDSVVTFQFIVKNIPYYLITSVLFTIIAYFIFFRKNKSVHAQ